MKVWHVFAVAIVLLLVGLGWFVFSDNKMNLMFQGARMSEAPAVAVSVPAAGTDLRAYSFIDGFGRFCTGTYSNEGGSWGDCEFPPNWEPNAAALEGMAKMGLGSDESR